MTMMKHLGRIVLVAIGLGVVQAVAGGLLFHAEAPEGPAVLPFLLAANLLTAFVLVLLAERSPARGGSLVGLLLAVGFGIPATYLVEVVFFDVGIPRSELPLFYLHAFIVGAGGALLAAGAVGKLTGGPQEPLRVLPLFAPRFGLAVLSYVFFYFAAGMLAWPFLKPFYETRTMPAVPKVALIQVFRGAALSLIVWWIARHEPRGRRFAALSAGLSLSIIGGVAPLLVPNAYLPDAVRHAHLVEVGVSNFLFGLLVAFLLA